MAGQDFCSCTDREKSVVRNLHLETIYFCTTCITLVLECCPCLSLKKLKVNVINLINFILLPLNTHLWTFSTKKLRFVITEQIWSCWQTTLTSQVRSWRNIRCQYCSIVQIASQFWGHTFNIEKKKITNQYL